MGHPDPLRQARAPILTGCAGRALHHAKTHRGPFPLRVHAAQWLLQIRLQAERFLILTFLILYHQTQTSYPEPRKCAWETSASRMDAELHQHPTAGRWGGTHVCQAGVGVLRTLPSLVPAYPKCRDPHRCPSRHRF